MELDVNSFQIPFGYLVFGVFLCCWAAVGAYTGKLWARFRWVYRVKEPNWFWFEVLLYSLAGLGFIGYYLHLTNIL